MSFAFAGRAARAALLAWSVLAPGALAAAPLDLGLLPPVIGASEQEASDRRSGIGLDGYDPVSYLLDGGPRPGSAAYEVVREGLAWRFASAANRAAFLRDPGAFQPRIGGYDAAAAAKGRIASADPLVFAVRDGRTYLFRNAAGRERFLAEAGAERAAEAGWARLRTGLVRG